MDEPPLTIASAAVAAGVGVETIRYYERRGLVPQPARGVGTFRRYGRNHVARIRFIKRAQQLGFSLEEIEGLLALQDGTRRDAVRRITSARLAEIRSRLADLRRMEKVLAELLDDCRHGGPGRCPIIEAIAPSEPVAAARRTKSAGAGSVRPTRTRAVKAASRQAKRALE